MGGVMSLCECGCGQDAPIARYDNKMRGHIKGQPVRFCAGHNQKLKKPPATRYPVVYVPGHPRANSSGCVALHIMLAERALGRRLPPGVEVHHVDGDRHDDKPTNLVICQDRVYHHLLHVRAKVVRAGANPNTHIYCGVCAMPKPAEAFPNSARSKTTGRGSRCNDCTRLYRLRVKQQNILAAAA
jgi:hypothetical protein